MVAGGRAPRVLPFIRDLTPQTDDLIGLIVVVHGNQGDRPKIATAIHEKWTKDGRRKGFTPHSIEANTVSSLSEENLGILDRQNRLTDFGRRLYRARKDPTRFKEVLAAHLLKHRGGWQFAKALTVLRQRGRGVTRDEVANYLAEKYGINEWRDLNNISALHGFLAWCGVVSSYKLDQEAFDRLMGATIQEVGSLERFTVETRACLQALVRLGGPATGGEIRHAAETYLRRQLDVHTLPSRIEPLIADGLVKKIDVRRGDRTGTYAVVNAKRAEVLAEVAADLAAVGAIPDEVFEHDFAWVWNRLQDDELSRDDKGRTLEILAAMICWKLGLRHVLLRERSPFEVDVTAEAFGSAYQSWSAQCKAYTNTQIRADHILREFGIAMLEGRTVLLFATTSDFTPDATTTAERITRESAVQVLMLNGTDLKRIAADQTALFDLVERRSREVRRLRAGDPPAVLFQELDAVRDWILDQKPGVEDVWLYLERRDLNAARSFVAAVLYAWLYGLRRDPRFDANYLDRVAQER
jgi:Restriction endonuclease